MTFEEEVTEIPSFLIEDIFLFLILYLTLNFHHYLLNLLKALFIYCFKLSEYNMDVEHFSKFITAFIWEFALWNSSLNSEPCQICWSKVLWKWKYRFSGVFLWPHTVCMIKFHLALRVGVVITSSESPKKIPLNINLLV